MFQYFSGLRGPYDQYKSLKRFNVLNYDVAEVLMGSLKSVNAAARFKEWKTNRFDQNSC